MNAPPILAAQHWKDNASLMETCRDLGYLGDDDTIVLDPTFGRGNWWRNYTPKNLIAHDIRIDRVDFRQLPEGDGTVDVVAFDPPYIPQGGRATSTLAESASTIDPLVPNFLDAYGLMDVPGTTAALHELIVDGAREMHRVLRPGGLLLLKCMSYTNGGRFNHVSRLLHAVEHVGFDIHDELVHVRTPGPQPGRLTQQRARRNYSLLFVLRRDRRPAQSQLFPEAGQ